MVLKSTSELEILYKGGEVDMPGLDKAVANLFHLCKDQMKITLRRGSAIPLDKSGKRNYFISMVGHEE